jgi:glycosyltransferase involved in cell wall biosynthesis
MNILFCHDGPINCDENNRYYSIGFNDKLFDRYAAIFGNVGIVTRVDRTSTSSTYTESDKLTVDKYSVTEYPNYLSLSGIFADKSKSTKLLESEISQCDALIIRLPSFLGGKCVRIAKEYNKPFLIELVGCPWDSLRNHGLSGKLLAPYMCLMTKYQVRRATDVLYVTNEFLQRRYPTSGRQIGCSDVELQNDNQNMFRVKAEHKSNDKKLIIGTVGKIDLKYKGHSTVIDAIKKMKAKGYDIQYQIVGPGDKSDLESYAMRNNVIDNIVFTGSMGHDKIFEWLDTINVYIQPSLTEGMPRALIEAMSRGCPCVASNAGGMPELLDKKFIFSKGNADQLANILLNTAQNGLLTQGLRNKEFTEQFSPNVIKEKRTAFYQEFQKYVMRRLQNE